MLGDLSKGQILLADRAYDSDQIRAELAAQGAWANVRPISQRLSKPVFSPFLYRYRNVVERFFSKLNRADETRRTGHGAPKSV